MCEGARNRFSFATACETLAESRPDEMPVCEVDKALWDIVARLVRDERDTAELLYVARHSANPLAGAGFEDLAQGTLAMMASEMGSTQQKTRPIGSRKEGELDVLTARHSDGALEELWLVRELSEPRLLFDCAQCPMTRDQYNSRFPSSLQSCERVRRGTRRISLVHLAA